LPWQHPLKNQKSTKLLNGVNKPLHLSTTEILVKIGPLGFEPPGLRRRPLKKFFKNKEKSSEKYIAPPASLPSGLNDHSL